MPAALVLLLVGGAAQALASHPETTLHRTIVRGDRFADRDAEQPPFFELRSARGQKVVVREDLADRKQGRAHRRRSLIYFAQLTDFQLADEESPLRTEYFDGDATGAWRPHEAFHPFALDMSMKKINALLYSPVRPGKGNRAKMALAVLTGDQADNQQFNETVWIRQLIEPGSRLHPGSGIEDFTDCDPASRLALEQDPPKGEPNYIGVQDYREFAEDERFYDPNRPIGRWTNWPRYPGVMNRAQRPFTTTGLKVDSYVLNGNHDSLVQGNEAANQAFEQIAIGCQKVRSTLSSDPLDLVESLLDPAESVPVPPDPRRRIVSKGEIRQIFAAGKQDDDHGFAFIDRDEDLASRRTAWYYAWDPKPGIRFIVIDTVSEGGVVADSSEGNIDDPQFQWLEGELRRASRDDKLIVVLGHHPVRSLRSRTPDEAATECAGGYDEKGRYTGPDRDPQRGHNHAVNPGCDGDPRPSEPIHDGEDLVELLHRFPHVIAYVPGHTHENCVSPFPDEDGGGFWELNTSAVADWPQQNRVIDVMNNRDGTLSIFSIVSDHASDLKLPNRRKRTADMSKAQLGALGRTFSYNDPDSSVNKDPSLASEFGSPPCPAGIDDEFAAEGRPEDRNVELLIRNPLKSGAGEGGAKSQGEDGPLDLPEVPELPEGRELPDLPDLPGASGPPDSGTADDVKRTVEDVLDGIDRLLSETGG